MGTINLSTLRGKEEEIVEVMEERRLDILGLCETRLKGSGDSTVHNNYRLVYSGVTNGKYGVGFMMTPSLASCVVSINQVSDRIINVSLIINSIGISLVQVYAPQQGRPAAEKETFYEQLQETVNNVRYGDRLIMCGDWNGHIGQERTTYEEIIGHHGVGDRNEDGVRVIDFASVNSLSIMNTFYQHQPSHKWTWYRYSAEHQQYTSRSMIDLFLTNQKKLFCDMKSLPSVSLDSDHRLVLASLQLKKPKQKPKVMKRRYKLEKLKNEEVVEHLREHFCREMASKDENVDNWCKFKDSITTAAEKQLGFRETYGGKKKSTPWWTEQVRLAVKRKMKLFRKWMKTRRPEDRLEYVLARNEAEEVKRKEKREVWRKIGSDLQEDYAGTKKLLYSMAKNYRTEKKEASCSIRDEDNNVITEEEQVMERWKVYFEKLLNVGRIEG